MTGPGGTRHAESRPGLEASLSGYWRAVYLETRTHNSEGGGGDGATWRPRRPPALLTAAARKEGWKLLRAAQVYANSGSSECVQGAK
jgi:hypothetical protein